MSTRAVLPPVRRRSVIQLFLSTGFGLGVSACGGGSSVPDEDRAASLLKTQADAAVASGMVGLTLGQVTPSATRVVVAGKRRQGKGALVLPQDRFAIGSNTKAMTSAAIVAMAELDGPALSLNLLQALPGWAQNIHSAYAHVTLADLLHHRGGLPAFNGSGAEEEAFLAYVRADTGPLPNTSAGRREYFARWLLSRPPVAGVMPGRDFLYSNAGYAIAAAIVELHTGKSFEAVFDAALVRPLGLQGAWRSEVPGAQDALWGHEGPINALAVVEATSEMLDVKDWLDALAPAGNWSCSGGEYAAWLRWHVLALRGGATPLPRTYVRDLRAVSDNRYVWGWQSVATPKRVLLTHTGHVPGFMAEAVLDLSGDFGMFGFSNTGYFAGDGNSWVLGGIDKALAEVLKQQSFSL